MKRSATFGISLAALTALFVATAIFGWRNWRDDAGQNAAQRIEQSPKSNLARSQIPFAFVENQGQWDARAKFVLRKGGMAAWFEKDAMTLRLEKPQAVDQTADVVARLAFAGASEAVQLEGENKQGGARNYFIGNDRSKWQANVASYGQILYRGLYDGIDLRVREHEGRLEYDLLLQPGADPDQVVIETEGVDRLELEPDGALVMHTPLGPICQKMPKTWYELPSGKTEPVECEYKLLDEGRFGFAIPDLDPTLALVIDPGLEWSTYVGGSGRDRAGFPKGLVVANNGDVLYCGTTNSMDFPVTAGAYDTGFAGDYEVFVSRWNPNLSGADQLVWSTFVGGSGFDRGDAIQVDESGMITVAGQTSSANFPTTSNAFDRTYNGGDVDGFILRLDPSGTSLLYSTFVGGSRSDRFQDLVVDTANNITATGWTSSPNFPVSLDAFDGSYNRGQDVVVTRLDLNQAGEEQLVWSTFLGGTRYDEGLALAVDAAGNVIVTGNTESRDFPTTPGAFSESHHGGPRDIFIARFDPEQSGHAQLLYATFFGGVGEDNVWTMAVDRTGIVTLSGDTWSEEFPVTASAYDRTLDSINDGFVSRFDLDLIGNAQLIYSTLIGGGWTEEGDALAVDDSGRVFLTGRTGSSGFPTTPNAYDRTYNGGGDGFALRLNPYKTGPAQLEYSTFLGGDDNDWATLLALDASGNMIIGGLTYSSDFPATQMAYQGTFAGGSGDAFLTKLVIGPSIPTAKTLFAKLDGSQEVAPVSSPGTGSGVFELSADSTALHYQISVKNLIGSITAAHFHAAPADSNGLVVKTIFAGGAISDDTTFTGVWSNSDAEPFTASLLTALCDEKIYVNVHTDSFPDGEIRGQVVVDTLATIARAVPGVIYAALGNKAGENSGSLIRMDPLTGAGTLIGPTGSDAASTLASTSTGEIFMADRGFLSRVDATSGTVTELGKVGMSPEGIAFDMNDRLYTIEWDGRLYVIDKQTAAATWIANLGAYVRGIAFDPTDNTLWASAGGGQVAGGGGVGPVDAIYTIDVATGEATLVGKTGFGVGIPGLAFDEDGNLFGVTGGGQRPNDFIAIDKTTGAGTVVGPVGFPAVSCLARRIPVPAGPQIALEAPSINVGNTEVGHRVARTVAITNYGAADLIITAIADPGAPFALTEMPALPTTIQRGEAVHLTVTFSPVTPGAASTNLVISSNDADDPVLTKELRGRGIDFENLGRAQHGVTYATTGHGDGGRLLSIDPETGAGTLIGPIGLDGVPGLAISSKGEIFATSEVYVSQTLYRLDAASGAEIKVGSMGLGITPIYAIAFDGNDVLYGFANWSGTLYQINTETAATTEVISIDADVRGMAFDPTDGTLWASTVAGGSFDAGSILTVDIATGEATLVGLTGIGSSLDIFFDAAGNLFGSTGEDDNDNDLIAIDKSTGAGTVIGPIGFKSVSGMAARLDRATGVESTPASLPKVFALAQSYPNPFNPSTVIRYDLPKSVHVKLVVYDILGRRVRTLVNADQLAGSRQTTWDGRNDAGIRVATGVYVYRIQAGDFTKTRKLMLIK